MTKALEQHRPEIAALCRQFGVRRLDVFGSAATDAFDPARSDYDFLVDLDSDAGGSLFTRYFSLKEGLEKLLGRNVDLVMIGALRNPYFIDSVNRTRQPVYASAVAKAA